jgi:ELWxxDGT repeat protein
VAVSSVVNRSAIAAVSIAIVLLMALPSAAAAADPQLVKDINPQGAGADPWPIVDFNGKAFTFACNGSSSNSCAEVSAVISDGTPAGTLTLATVGSRSGDGWFAGNTAALGENLYFLTNDALWSSDGTPGGTFAVTSVDDGLALTRMGSYLYFKATDALYRSDGTAVGTKPIYSGRTGWTLVPAGNTLFFENLSEAGLWMSDGTSAGTKRVPGSPTHSVIGWLTSVGSRVFYTVNTRELWVSDGTRAGTHLVKDIDPTRYDSIRYPVAVGNTLFFRSRDATHGYELWKSDGTAAGTVMVRNIRKRSASSSPSGLIDVGGTLFFTANDGVHGVQLWKSDGTKAGTTAVSSTIPTDIWDGQQVAVGSTLYFSAVGAGGDELWKSDGTTAGTTRVKDINPAGDSSPRGFAAVGSRAFFAADDGVHGVELWVSDGTAAGTRLAVDLNLATQASDPQLLGQLGSSALFAANDGLHGAELWTSDGSADGTQLLKDIVPGPAGALRWSQGASVGALVYFTVYGAGPHTQLWKTDGTALGTVQVADIGNSDWYSLAPFGDLLAVTDGTSLWVTDGATGGTTLLKSLTGRAWVNSLTSAGDALYFLVKKDGYIEGNSAYLWKTDGTVAGTMKVSTKNFWGSSDFSFAALGNRVYFCAEERGGLWRSNGTAAGTKEIADVYCSELTTVNTQLFFASGNELWKSDGTKAGTAPVRAFAPDSGVHGLTAVGSTLFFTASDESPYAHDLWKTDGTAVGTLCLSADMIAVDLVSAGGRLYFAGGDANGWEPWTSDGTAAGTFALGDIAPGPDSSWPRGFIEVGGQVLFAADNADVGRELWVVAAP